MMSEMIVDMVLVKLINAIVEYTSPNVALVKYLF
jgi:hypothetical protein